MRAILNRLIYDLMYRLGKPVWDSGLTPPEVVKAIEREPTPGRALDLGCGTGTQSIHLAQHGWKVVGVDFSPKAIALGVVKKQLPILVCRSAQYTIEVTGI